jgi:glycosyltransferase involved in cell wall biosynthesis
MADIRTSSFGGIPSGDTDDRPSSPVIGDTYYNGETGILVPLEQETTAPFEAAHPDQFAKDLAAGINRLMGDEKLRESMGALGRKRVEKYFDWKAIAQQTQNLYNKILNHDK